MRQLDLAFAINKSANYINDIENSKYFPSPEAIEKMAEVLEIEPMHLFDRTDPHDSAKNAPLVVTPELTQTLFDQLKTDIHAVLRKDIQTILGE